MYRTPSGDEYVYSSSDAMWDTLKGTGLTLNASNKGTNSMRVDEEGEILDNVKNWQKITRAKYPTPTKTSPADLKCAIPGEEHTPFLAKRAQGRTCCDNIGNIPSTTVVRQKDAEEMEDVYESEEMEGVDRSEPGKNQRPVEVVGLDMILMVDDMDDQQDPNSGTSILEPAEVLTNEMPIKTTPKSRRHKATVELETHVKGNVSTPENIEHPKETQNIAIEESNTAFNPIPGVSGIDTHDAVETPKKKSSKTMQDVEKVDTMARETTTSQPSEVTTSNMQLVETPTGRRTAMRRIVKRLRVGVSNEAKKATKSKTTCVKCSDVYYKKTDNSKSKKGRWIVCEKCEKVWVHASCVGIPDDKIDLPETHFYCAGC